MPLGKVFDAREGQVLPSPVRNYYQGKAVRAGIAAQEKETAQADEKLDLERRRVAAAEAGVGLRKLENDLATAAGQREMVLHAAAASMQAYESNPDLPEEERREKAWDASVAVLDHHMPGGRDAVLATFQERGEPTGAAGFDPEETIALLTDPDQFFEGRKGSTVLTLKEKLKMGMAQDWAERSVVERDETGNVSVTSQPTGITAGDLESRGGVNASGVSKNTIDFQDNVIGAVGAVQMGTELIASSKANPESLGVPGGMMRFGSNLVSGAKAIADWANYEALEPEKTEVQDMGYGGFDYGKVDLTKLGVSGAEAEKFRAGVYGIAFAAAVAEQGTRPTDKDIQQFIDQVGGRATSAQSFRETIVQFMRRQDRRLKTIADVKQIGGVDRDAAFESWTPAFRNFMDTYAKTSGKRTAANKETGEKMIEMSPGKWEAY